MDVTQPRLCAVQGAELLRRRYLPKEVRVLFVGESPPSGGTFFYAANSNLYFATQEAFVAASSALEGKDFLEEFRRMGCHLDDLCLEPVNHLDARDPARRAARVEVRNDSRNTSGSGGPRPSLSSWLRLPRTSRVPSARHAWEHSKRMCCHSQAGRRTATGTSLSWPLWSRRLKQQASSSADGGSPVAVLEAGRLGVPGYQARSRVRRVPPRSQISPNDPEEGGRAPQDGPRLERLSSMRAEGE